MYPSSSKTLQNLFKQTFKLSSFYTICYTIKVSLLLAEDIKQNTQMASNTSPKQVNKPSLVQQSSACFLVSHMHHVEHRQAAHSYK